MQKSSYIGVLQSHGWNTEFPYNFLDETSEGSPRPFQSFHSSSNTSECPASFTTEKGIFMWNVKLCRQKSSLSEWILVSNRVQTLIFDSSWILPSRLSPTPGESSCLKAGTPLPSDGPHHDPGNWEHLSLAVNWMFLSTRHWNVEVLAVNVLLLGYEAFGSWLVLESRAQKWN